MLFSNLKLVAGFGGGLVAVVGGCFFAVCINYYDFLSVLLDKIMLCKKAKKCF
jgi:hypothetical protein